MFKRYGIVLAELCSETRQPTTCGLIILHQSLSIHKYYYSIENLNIYNKLLDFIITNVYLYVVNIIKTYFAAEKCNLHVYTFILHICLHFFTIFHNTKHPKYMALAIVIKYRDINLFSGNTF